MNPEAEQVPQPRPASSAAHHERGRLGLRRQQEVPHPRPKGARKSSYIFSLKIKAGSFRARRAAQALIVYIGIRDVNWTLVR
jgi:hypothetical protein